MRWPTGSRAATGCLPTGASSAFPTQTWNTANYWVDVVFRPGAAPTLQSIAVTPTNPRTILMGATQQFTATGTYSDSSTQNLTGQATWASSNTSVATVVKRRAGDGGGCRDGDGLGDAGERQREPSNGAGRAAVGDHGVVAGRDSGYGLRRHAGSDRRDPAVRLVDRERLAACRVDLERRPPGSSAGRRRRRVPSASRCGYPIRPIPRRLPSGR